jgi:PIN domain nuclease of toxin-antitoxin system
VNLLLDAATFLWWTTGSEHLSGEARAAIGDPTRLAFVSAVSMWEIALKHGLGKLPLPEDPSVLLPRLRAQHGFEELALGEAAALQLPKLPSVHRDPFDRMLVCQAIEHGLTIVTPDSDIRRYPVRTLW